jgi:hypothetical protein
MALDLALVGIDPALDQLRQLLRILQQVALVQQQLALLVVDRPWQSLAHLELVGA